VSDNAVALSYTLTQKSYLKMKWFNKDKNLALPWPATYKLRAELEIEILRRFLELVSRQRKEQETSLRKVGNEAASEGYQNQNDLEEYLESLSDEFWMLDLAQKQAERLTIVGLYRIVELGTRNMFLWIYDDDKQKIRLLHQWKKQKEILRKDLEYDLQTTRGYDAVDELRCLNNVIKHADGIVDKNLSRFPNWKEGDEVENLDNAFERLAPSVPPYLKDLAESLNEILVQNDKCCP